MSDDEFKAWSTTRQTLTVAGALLVLLIVGGALAGGSSTDTTDTTTTTKSTAMGDPAVDRNTRAYAKSVNACRLSAAIVRGMAAKGETNLLDMADLAAQPTRVFTKDT